MKASSQRVPKARYYYYRSMRRGGKVVREYVGRRSDPVVGVLIEAEQLQRAEARAAMEMTNQEQAQYIVAERALLRLLCRLDFLSHLGKVARDSWPPIPRTRVPDGDDQPMAKADPTRGNIGITRDEFDALVERADEGDAAARQELKMLLRACPRLLKAVADLPRYAEDKLVQLIAGKSAPFAEGIRGKLTELREELGFSWSPPLERLLIERVVITWLDCQFAHMAELQPRTRKADTKFWQQCHNRADRRYLRALKALAMVRGVPVAGAPVQDAGPSEGACRQAVH